MITSQTDLRAAPALYLALVVVMSLPEILK